MPGETDIDDGEWVDVIDPDTDVTDTPDGGAFVDLGDDDERTPSTDFGENLADTQPSGTLSRLASQFIDLIEKDRDARKKRDDQYEEGLRRTGLGDDAPGGAQFEGASKVVHPMLTEACIDFKARVMKEIWPVGGPVGTRVEGDISAEKDARARRKAKYMNWQLTVQVREARAELSQLMTQVPLGGSQYLKCTWKEARNRPDFLFVPIDDMLLPYAATNFYSSQRKTHVQYLTEVDYEERVAEGMYRDVDLSPADMVPEQTGAAKANDKIEGRDASSYNVDGLRTVYEIHTVLRLDDDDYSDGLAPYILTIDDTTRQVLSLYRNWDEFDESREELQWFVEFPFIPWRGAYAIGLPHIIGGLAAASTGALRALLDSAHINNAPTMLKLKGGSRGGQSLEIQPTQVLEIEGGINVDDIRKLAMPVPFNQPSPVLYQLLGFLVDTARGTVRTSLDDLQDISADAPVGTTLARMEQGLVVFSDIHLSQHDAFSRMLAILHRLNGMYLDEERAEKEFGGEVRRKDFTGAMDTIPVSDPNIYSEAQRYAQAQAVAARADAHPDIYDRRKVEKHILTTLKVPNPDAMLGPDLNPVEDNAVNENVFASTGKALLAFPRQDHIAHLKTHLGYMVNPMLGMSDLIAPTFLPIVIEHIKQHIAMWYASAVREIANDETGLDISDAKKKLKGDTDKQAFDRMLAEASQIVVERAQDIFGGMEEVIAQAQQIVTQYQKAAAQPPMDPASQVAMQNVQMQQHLGELRGEIAKMQIMQKDQSDQRRIEIDRERLAADTQLRQEKIDQTATAVQVRAATDAEKQAAEDRRTAAEIDGRLAGNVQDNRTALQIAGLEAVTGKQASVTTGTGINPGE